ncbi:MAG: ABC transporter permease [Lachnospiraceae bacterium]|nr:ABC transporter permease [Lachnospiraceae bacterium]
MKYFTLLRANIKSQKGSFVGIFMLIFIITVSLCAVLSIWKNSGSYEEEQIDRLGFGDITWWVMRINSESEDMKRLTGQISGVDDVEAVEVRDCVFCDVYHVIGNDDSTIVKGTIIALAWDDVRYDYHVYNSSLTGIEETVEDLKEGEVYVSPAFQSLYGAQIGDVLEIEITGEQDVACYTIKGFFEDPISGSAMMGMKDVLMTKADMQRLTDKYEAAGDRQMGRMGSMLHVFKAKNSSLNMGEFQRLLGDETDLYKALSFSYSKSTIMGFMLILQDIFSGFLLAFVLILLITTMIIIGHSISSSIEQDYVDMGIMKAVGYTGIRLRALQVLQYLLVVLCGMALGVPASSFVVRLIERMTVTTTGLVIPSNMPVGISFLVLGAVGLFIMGFVYIRTAKIKKVLPIQAIRGGAGDIYFKSRLTASIRQRGINFRLAYRQLISGKKQYISACFISALLVFFLALTARVDAWIGEDGQGLMESFNAVPYDFGVQYDDEETKKEAEEWIDAQAGIICQYEFKMTRAAINQIEYLMNVTSAPEYFNILEGRTCLYNNEAVITDFVSKELGIGIGDTVSINYSGEEKDFIISGIYQCANDMGTNFAISKEGIERFGEEAELSYYWYYQLRDPSMAAELTDSLNEMYKEAVNIDTNTWSGVDSIVLAMSALTKLMYVITIVFILVTVYLTGSKVLYREQHDLGIYKSLGFVSEKLRLAFALRFGMVAVAGSLLGIALSAFLTDPVVSAMLAMCGISHFTSALNPFNMVMLAGIVSGLFFAFAYLAAKKIKKVGVGILIVE